ncbi:MAG: CPBP family intramembrane metalloprotease [Gammaproteobacteria bacterium]
MTYSSNAGLATYCIMCLSILSLWVKHPLRIANASIKIWVILFAIVLFIFTMGGLVQISGFLFCLSLLLASYLSTNMNINSKIRIFSFFMLLALCLSLSFNLISGFSKVAISNNIFIGSSKEPIVFSIYFGKFAMIVFLTAIAYNKLSHPQEIPRLLLYSLAFGGAWIPLVLFVGYLLGAQFEFKIHSSLLLYASMNLFFTCILEEVFFRGLIQNKMKEYLATFTVHHHSIAIGITSLLFGVAHLSGGTKMIIAATIAGIGYGIIYDRTQKIECAIFLHFLLNVSTFITMVYPISFK